MKLHNFIIQLIQSNAIDLAKLKSLILNPNINEELQTCLLKNYECYELLLRIKDGMDLGWQGRT